MARQEILDTIKKLNEVKETIIWYQKATQESGTRVIDSASRLICHHIMYDIKHLEIALRDLEEKEKKEEKEKELSA